jgi:hypothetical protein
MSETQNPMNEVNEALYPRLLIENLKITLEITATDSSEGYVLEVSGYDYRENGRPALKREEDGLPFPWSTYEPGRIHCRTIEEVQSHLLGIVGKLL